MSKRWDSCLYDNPDTMCREHWVDGRMFSHLSFDVMFRRDTHPVWENLKEKYQADSPWQCGQVLGDPEALIKDDEEQQ